MLLPPKVVAVEVRPSASVQRHNQTRTGDGGYADGGLASSAASAATLPPTATGTLHRPPRRTTTSVLKKQDAPTMKERLLKQLEDARLRTATSKGPSQPAGTGNSGGSGGDGGGGGGGYVPDESQWSRQEKLSTAMNLIKQARQVGAGCVMTPTAARRPPMVSFYLPCLDAQVVDPQRCYFQAGLLFDEVAQVRPYLTPIKAPI